ncbi:hypothetical protein MTR_1g007650 [Medicago truncatula]|uniref:Uncharacterized protein n=1 Tax=Medicago truncatula TaxID=3880 RepID=G7I3E4_MEDTR|nr:hypothetical protein MTR_1g007650 [Medicago truncatula]
MNESICIICRRKTFVASWLVNVTNYNVTNYNAIQVLPVLWRLAWSAMRFFLLIDIMKSHDEDGEFCFHAAVVKRVRGRPTKSIRETIRKVLEVNELDGTKIIKDRETGRSHKEASAALESINMKNQDPNGRRVRVNYATESWCPSYSVPSNYHDSHLKTSYAS